MLLKGRDIVIIGIQPWYFEIGSNCKNIALEFSKKNRVLYVDMPVNRKTLHAKELPAGIQQHINIINEKGDTIKKIKENLWEFYPISIVESINWLPSTKIFKIVNGINNRRFANDIKTAIKKLGFKNIILFNDNDFFNGYDLKKLLLPSVYLYYCRDYLRGFDYWKKHGDVLEPEMIKMADAAVANSLYLAEYCSSFNSNSFYIGQGCDLDLFDAEKEHSLPDELKKIASPIIGYVGALITERLDVGIIETIARANPLWNVVLVGPEDENFKKSILHEMPNVYFLGRKSMEQLPAFIKNFDVCINPQLINNVTIGNYPLKVDEYLAMGKPVVATSTKTMELFKDHTYLAEKPQDYPLLVEKALEENNVELQQARIAFAKTHTWENCLKEIGNVVTKMESAPV